MFDLRTHIADPKTGKLLVHQPYRLVIDQQLGTYFIRNGKKYLSNGEEIVDQPVAPAAVPAVEEPKAPPEVRGRHDKKTP